MKLILTVVGILALSFSHCTAKKTHKLARFEDKDYYGEQVCKGVVNYTFMPHWDCERYYFCMNGESEIMSCPSGYYFDSNYGICRPGKCNLCGSYETGTLIPIPDDYHKFRVCLNGHALEMECPMGTYFDADILQCRPGDFTSRSDPSFFGCQDYEVRRMGSECSSFIACKDNHFIVKDCPKDTYFDSEYMACRSILPTAHYACSCLLPENSVLVNTNECDAYDVCINGVPITKKCPQGQFFNHTIKACLLDVEGICVLEPFKKPMQLETPEAVCNNKDFGFHPDTKDCRKFFMCAGGKAFTKTCADGLYFDTSVKSCIWDKGNRCPEFKSDNTNESYESDETDESNVSDESEDFAYFFQNYFNTLHTKNMKPWQKHNQQNYFYKNGALKKF